MAAVVFTVDASTRLGHARDLERRHRRGRRAQQRRADSVRLGRPLQGAAAPCDARAPPHRRERGARLQVPPDRAGLRPERRAVLPAVRGDCRMPASVALFHTGQTGIGAGLPGGYGLRLGLSNPMLLDAVAADFPDLQIIMAHPSVPWQDEALSVATHKHNTWIDLSGWSPKYFPESAGPRRELVPEESRAVRLRLPPADARPLDPRCRADEPQARGDARHHEGQRGAAAGTRGLGAAAEPLGMSAFT